MRHRTNPLGWLIFASYSHGQYTTIDPCDYSNAVEGQLSYYYSICPSNAPATPSILASCVCLNSVWSAQFDGRLNNQFSHSPEYQACAEYDISAARAEFATYCFENAGAPFKASPIPGASAPALASSTSPPYSAPPVAYTPASEPSSTPASSASQPPSPSSTLSSAASPSTSTSASASSSSSSSSIESSQGPKQGGSSTTDSTPTPFAPAMQSSSSGSGLSEDAKIGLGVGIPSLILTAIATAYTVKQYHLRRRQYFYGSNGRMV